MDIDSPEKVRHLEDMLNSGKITIVLIFADWCGACHRFRDNIWKPMTKKKAIHNRIALRDDMVQNTSLAGTKFEYLPSIIVVDENGQAQTFETPDGGITNAMPTPKNLKDMTRIVNVSLMNASQTIKSPKTVQLNTRRNRNRNNSRNSSRNRNSPPFSMTPIEIPSIPSPQTPNGSSYIAKGGALLKALRRYTRRR